MKEILKKNIKLFFSFFNLTFPVKINKQWYKIPTIGRLGFRNIFISEFWMISILEKITGLSDGAYIDVGVNTGQTLLKVRSIDKTIPYIGFEPNSACIYYTKKLIEKNNLHNVTLFPCAIADVNQLLELNFFYDSYSDPSATIIHNFRPDEKVTKKEYIASFTLSQITKTITFPKISILKIDVEGAEKEVLEQFKDLIIKDQPFIQLEILPVRNNADRLQRQQAIEELLNALNYTIFRIDYNSKTKFLNGLTEIKTIGIHSDLTKCEYLVVPSNQKESIKSIFKII